VIVKIFVSHAHIDAAIAAALKKLLVKIFDDIEVDYSADLSAGGGIEAGANWLQWILDKVRSCNLAVVVLTPESLSRPWLMWESGAVNGIALALEEQRQIVPLLFRVNRENLTGPLSHLQAEQGETGQGIRRAVLAVWDLLGRKPGKEKLELLFGAALPGYLEQIQEFLQDRPQSLDKGGVQEWCERLDELRRAGRHTEVGHVHRALLLAVGPAADDANQVPLDVRLHRRLGELYLATGRGHEAAVQFDLALRLFSRDVFLMHKLALAQLETRDRGRALATLKRIEELDQAAVFENPDVAGLKGRLYREEWQATSNESDLRTARDAYQAALTHSPTSYYMAGNVGELSLALNERKEADQAYQHAVDAIRRTGERTWWSLATRASAAIVQGKEKEAIALLGEAGALGPPARDAESIRQGLKRLQTYLKVAPEVAAGWLGAFAGGQASVGGAP
jgi:tetratricopeptide (TPR) repeat protein